MKTQIKHPKAVFALALTIGVIASVVIIAIRGRINVPFVYRDEGWSIGIYSGDSPSHFDAMPDVKNPVLTAKDVTDIEAQFVADPFMVFEENTWYLFFEVKNATTQQGDIGLATSADAKRWTYQKIILDEPFHLSYPYVFKWEQRYYMVPESYQANSVRLYEATKFPTEWRFVTNLISDVRYADSSLFRYNDMWWLFTSSTNHASLSVYYSSNLFGPWSPHSANPIVQNDPTAARPGGRMLVEGQKIYRYAQIDKPTYGYGLRAYEINLLTPTAYRETEIKDFKNLMATGHSWAWNGRGMHTIDPHDLGGGRWVACVDGTGRILRFGR